MSDRVDSGFNASSIIIRCPNWVGDVVMATPAIRAVRNRFPGASLCVFIKSYAKALLHDSPHINEIIEYEDAGEHRGTGAYYRLLLGLRRRKFDLAILLPNSFRAAWEMRIARAKRRVGYATQGRGFLLTDPVPAPRENGKRKIMNMVDYYLALCRHIGCTDLDTREELFVSAEGEAAVEELLQEHNVGPGETLIGVVPGAGYGPSKIYPPERYARALDALVDRFGCRVVVITSPKEAPIAERLISAMEHPSIWPCEPVLDMDALKSLIQRCALLITNDTGPRHIAVAFDRPVVVVFGPTSTLYTDVNLEKTRIVRAQVDCSPCQLKECPTDHRCMTRIEPEQVVQAAVELLERFPPR